MPDGPPSPEDAPPSAPTSDSPPELREPDGAEEEDAPGPREETVEEILEPKVNPVERVLSDVRGQSRSYTQGSFLYFQQIELYGLLGRAVGIVLDSEGGMGMDELFKMMNPKETLDGFLSQMQNVPGAEDAPDRKDEDAIDSEQAAKMMAAFSRLIASSPGILKEFQIIVLDIPEGHRKWALDWALSRVDRETGNDIMHTFIDQNWGILESFFTEEIPKLAKRAAAARRRHKSNGGRSKP